MDDLKPATDAEPSRFLDRARAQTPARILTPRFGGSYSTRTWLELRADHAAARDAVRDEIDLEADLGRDFLDRWGLFEVSTRASTKDEFLLRPELGRSLGRSIGEFRKASNELKSTLEEEIRMEEVREQRAKMEAEQASAVAAGNPNAAEQEIGPPTEVSPDQPTVSRTTGTPA